MISGRYQIVLVLGLIAIVDGLPSLSIGLASLAKPTENHYIQLFAGLYLTTSILCTTAAIIASRDRGPWIKLAIASSYLTVAAFMALASTLPFIQPVYGWGPTYGFAIMLLIGSGLFSLFLAVFTLIAIGSYIDRPGIKPPPPPEEAG